MSHLVEIKIPKKRQSKKGKQLSRFQYVKDPLRLAQKDNKIFSLDSFETEKYQVITCRCPTGELGYVLDLLRESDVGEEGLGELNVYKLEASVPVMDSGDGPAMPLQLIYSQINSGASVSFDYIVFLIVASIIAGIGLATDNSVTVVASMLVSPLMGPILAFTFGSILWDWHLIKRGLWAEFVGILVVWLCGAVIGLIFSPFGNEMEWPAAQMADRGTAFGLLIGAGIAFPSGIGVAMSVAGGVISSLVGVAISAALLPPIVNSGMNFVYALIGGFFNDGVDPVQYFTISLFSFLLLVVNILFIFIGGIIAFKVKQFAPFKKKIAWDKVNTWNKVEKRKTLINFEKVNLQ